MRRERDETADALDAELRLHIELRVEQLVAQGWTRDAARAEAERRLGGTAAARRSLYRAARRRDRRMRLRELGDALRQDLRLAVRTLAREPGFAATVIVTMALAIGANAAMFGVLDRLLLRGPDHVRDPASVMRVYARAEHPRFGDRRAATVGYVTYSALRDGAPSVFANVAAWKVDEAILGRAAESATIRLGAATWDFFDLLGVRPELGRFYGEEEDRPPAGADVVVLSHELWRARFGGDPEVPGRVLVINGEPRTVIGVAPAGFTGVDLGRVDAWIPMSRASRTIDPDWPATWRAQWLYVVARLRPGVDGGVAAAAATEAWQAARADAGVRREVEPHLELAGLAMSPTGEEPLESRVARWLVGVAAVVLLIACANVMNLLLARGMRRRRETAVRVALGIGRARLARSLLVETLLLVGVGGAAALGVSAWSGRLIRATLLPHVAWTAAAVDGRVIVFTLVITVATALVTTLVPAVRFAGRADPADALRSGVREGGGRRARLRTGLTIVQAALSVLLLVGAGLFVRSLGNALDEDLGIDAGAVLAIEMHWPPTPASEGTIRIGGQTVGRDDLRSERAGFYARALERAAALPGVEHAALSVGTPFHTTFVVGLRTPGRDSVPELPGGGPFISAVTSDYFAATGTRVVRGRTFEPGEGAGTEPVTIVNEPMARILWPGEDALGQCLMIGDEDDVPCSRVVGIVEETRRYGLREETAMQYYVPFGQERGFGGTMLLVRPRADVAAAVPALRTLLQELDTRGGYVDIESLRDAIAPQIRPWRMGTLLFGLFGGLALLIAGIGMYSVVAYGVAQRTRELGVRMVLGARRGDVRGMVLRQGARVALIGVVIGVAIALVAGRLAQALLFDVSAADPLVLASVAALLVAVALLASWIPAMRATRVDPVVALRSD